MSGLRTFGTALVLALTAAGGCAQAQSGAQPASAPPAAQRESGVHRFKVGQLDATVLFDGGMTVPNDGKFLWKDEGAPAVAAVLKAAGLPTETISLDINTLLVRTGERLFLLDTGNGPAAKGKLPASLAAAGITPAQVTDIVISHGHPDHIGGLLTANGGPAFPNAKVRMTAAEWASIQGAPRAAALVKAISGQVEIFQPGATLAPGLTAVEVRGHTPGHTAVLVESGGQRLIAIGDSAHHYVVSVREPEFTIPFDGDAPTAEASRRALLQRAVDEKLTVFAPHFPYPGLGTIRTEGDGFAWVPAK
jgi:glyoxylase-like metal-dependent hydrolase (beta-lactamase superfamily II)